MGSVWEGIRKAAATGAAKAQTAAENAVHRMEIQRRISQHEDELQSAFAGIGRELYAAVRGGQPVPEGVNLAATWWLWRQAADALRRRRARCP